MKSIQRLLMVILAAALCAALLSATALAAPAGDANGDNMVDAMDAVTILRSLAGLSEPVDIPSGDVNGDGHVNAADAVLILRGDIPAEPEVYTVTLDANGGSVDVTELTVTGGSEIGTLPTPTKYNNTFDGWYTEASGGTKITTSTVPSGNTTYYAHWTEAASGTIIYYATSSSGTGITELSQMTSTQLTGTTLDIPYTSLSDEFVFVAIPSSKSVVRVVTNFNGFEIGCSDRGSIGTGYNLYRIAKQNATHTGPIMTFTIQ